MKIIHCANFSESKNGSVYYSIDKKISNGLIRNSHFVYDFSYREIAKNSTILKSKKFGLKYVNKKLIETVKNIEPELLLLGHSELIDDKTLLNIKQLFPNIKIAMWYVDWIFNLNNISSRLKIIDNFFITTDPIELNGLGLKKEIIDKCEYLPNFCDDSIDSFKSYENKKYDYDLLFIGRYDKEREPFINFLKNTFTNLNLGLFGLDKNNIITGTNYLKTIASSKIGINYSRRNDISMYSSDRIIHLMANGVLVFSPKIPNLEQIFSDTEIVYFSTQEDLKNKVEFYLKNSSERIKIAKEGWKKAHSCYNEKIITKNIINTIFKGQK
jgi:spore maturation protein CgeB